MQILSGMSFVLSHYPLLCPWFLSPVSDFAFHKKCMNRVQLKVVNCQNLLSIDMTWMRHVRVNIDRLGPRKILRAERKGPRKIEGHVLSNRNQSR